MERIKSLIEKLNMQFSQNVPLSQLLSTVQLLQNEIAGNMREVNVLGASSISVIVPHAKSIVDNSASNVQNAQPLKHLSSLEEEKEYYELIVDSAEYEESTLDRNIEIPSYEELMKLQQHLTASEQSAKLSFSGSAGASNDMPTLSRQSKSTTSKAAKQASSPKAGRSAIKDLYKAINAQDRILFVRELFRGDEIMFERSIKTINNFNSFAEAAYWVEREFKTKNGWMSGNPAVDQFEQLLKRRFS